jgi:hypothetical protein
MGGTGGTSLSILLYKNSAGCPRLLCGFSLIASASRRHGLSLISFRGCGKTDTTVRLRGHQAIYPRKSVNVTGSEDGMDERGRTDGGRVGLRDDDGGSCCFWADGNVRPYHLAPHPSISKRIHDRHGLVRRRNGGAEARREGGRRQGWEKNRYDLDPANSSLVADLLGSAAREQEARGEFHLFV